MRRLYKSRRGFTLVELILVMTIIVILVSVTALSIKDYISRAQRANSSVVDNVSTARHNISASEAKLAGYGF